MFSETFENLRLQMLVELLKILGSRYLVKNFENRRLKMFSETFENLRLMMFGKTFENLRLMMFTETFENLRLKMFGETKLLKILGSRC